MDKDEQIDKLMDEKYLLTQMPVKAIKEFPECQSGNEKIHDVAVRIKNDCEAEIEEDNTGSREFWFADVLTGVCD